MEDSRGQGGGNEGKKREGRGSEKTDPKKIKEKKRVDGEIW